jgi:hypothetical protein
LLGWSNTQAGKAGRNLTRSTVPGFLEFEKHSSEPGLSKSLAQTVSAANLNIAGFGTNPAGC